MGVRSGSALRWLQTFVRAVQLCCALVVLALFSYFLATLHNHGLRIDDSIRAVEGISGAAVLYTLISLLILLCCGRRLVGYPATSAVSVFLDVCFAITFIYVAVANRGGAGSCNGYVSTPFGTGDASNNVVDDGNGGFTALPSLRQACQMETGCLAASIVAIFFFVLSAVIEVYLARHRRKEKRFGPSPANNYTSGYAKKRGLFGFRRKRAGTAGNSEDPNALPSHTHPADVRDSYATEQTRVGTAHGDNQAGAGAAAAAAAVPGTTAATAGTGYNKYGYPEPGGYGYPSNNNSAHLPAAAPDNNNSNNTHVAHYPPGNYRYGDGVYNSNDRV